MNFFKKLSLGTKLVISFGLIVFVIVLTAYVSMQNIKRLSELSTAIELRWMPAIVKSSELKENIASIRALQLNLILAKTPEQGKAAEENLSSAMGSFQIYLKSFESEMDSDEAAEIYKQLNEDWEKVIAMNDSFVQNFQQGNSTEALALLHGELTTTLETISSNLKKIADIEYSGGMDAVKLSAETFLSTKVSTSVNSTIAILISILVSVGVYYSVTKSLNLIISQLNACASDTRTYSTDLSLTSESLAKSVSQASSSITETSSAIEEITSMVENTAENTESSKASSAASRESVQEAQRVCEKLAQSLNDLSQGINNNDERIGTVLTSFEEIVRYMKSIDQKTQMINDIVFQTKLLSFNASVESARAGEYGKGFSVVADEVGKLAEMSGKTSMEINSIVRDSLAKVSEIAVEAKGSFEKLSAENHERLTQGQATLAEFNHIFESVVGGVQLVTDKINEIYVASQEQAKGVREISQALVQLDQATQLNSTSSTKVSHSAEQMNHQVDQLMDAVEVLQKVLHGEAFQPKEASLVERSAGDSNPDEANFANETEEATEKKSNAA